MNILVGGVSSDRQYVKSLTSFYRMHLREGDERVAQSGMTGLQARRNLGMLFEAHDQFGAIMLCDLDMVFPKDTLEKLRTHLERDDVDVVSGHYFRRHTDPMQSVVKEDRGGWPFVPWVDIPTEGLHEVGSIGFGCVLISRKAYFAVQERLGEHPFNDGPLRGYVADAGGFGPDVRFCIVARELGFRVWVDASIECPHGHTVWLTKQLYDILGHRDSQQPYWHRLVQTSREVNGMDKKTAQLRIEELRMARKQAHEQLLAVQQQANELKTRLVIIDGQIAEREMDLASNGPSGRFKLPVYESEEEALEAINRNKRVPIMHEDDLEAKIAAREEKYREESKARLDLLDD